MQYVDTIHSHFGLNDSVLRIRYICNHYKYTYIFSIRITFQSVQIISDKKNHWKSFEVSRVDRDWRQKPRRSPSDMKLRRSYEKKTLRKYSRSCRFAALNLTLISRAIFRLASPKQLLPSQEIRDDSLHAIYLPG